MASNKLSELKVGAFVFVAAFIVLFTVFWAKGFTVNLSQQEYRVYFPKVSGLNEGDQVSVNGVRKGKIDRIELVGDSVGITFSIDKSIRIKKDYDIYVASTELTGGKVLYVEPGKSETEVDPQLALHGNPGSDFATLMNSVSEITTDVKSLIGEFKKSTDNLNSVLTNINQIAGDEGLKSNIRTTLSNLAVSSANLNSLVSDSRNNINRIASRLDNTVSNVDDAVGDNSRELKNTLLEIQKLTGNIDSLTSNLNSIALTINNKDKGLGKFIADDKFYDKINSSLAEIEKLTKDIRKNGIKLNIF